MSFSSQDFKNAINESFGHDYSAYFDDARINEIIKEAFIKAVEIKYADLTSEKNTDELFTLIKTSVPLTLAGNQIALLTIPQYLHVLALQTSFSVLLDAKVKGATNAKPVMLSLDKLTNLRDGDLINISGVVGNLATNGDRYVQKIYDDFSTSTFTFQLYYDQKLTNPVIGNGVYTKGGVVKIIIKEWAKKKNSYRKYSTFDESTVNDPYWEVGQGFLKALPNTETCSSILLDYISVPATYPDVTNTTVDLEQTFTLRFIYFWKDETVRIMMNESRDTEGIQIENSEIINQP